VSVTRSYTCGYTQLGTARYRRPVTPSDPAAIDVATPPEPAEALPPLRPSRGNRAAARRRERQQEIVTSTRRLFDARGMRAANIEDIASAVGVNRAIIYRHFSSKEELFALTLADYLTELDGRLSAVDDASAAARARLEAVSREFATYCLEHPAFVDCALSLLGKPGPMLLDEISEGALLRLGSLMAGELRHIAGLLVLDRGEALSLEDAELLANALYMQVLGVMHLARSGVIVRPSPSGLPVWAPVDADRIVDLVVQMGVAVVTSHVPPA
jgi:AcrR family transcriptional regulator